MRVTARGTGTRSTDDSVPGVIYGTVGTSSQDFPHGMKRKPSMVIVTIVRSSGTSAQQVFWDVTNSDDVNIKLYASAANVNFRAVCLR